MPSLSLVSDLSIEEPLARLTTFCEHEYAYYDAVPTDSAGLFREPIPDRVGTY